VHLYFVAVVTTLSQEKTAIGHSVGDALPALQITEPKINTKSRNIWDSKAHGPTVELTRRRDISSFRLHPSSLQFTLPPLASNDLFGAARK